MPAEDRRDELAKGGGSMGDVVNLNRYRKQRQRIEDAKQAAENRARFSRDKAERAKSKAEQEREARNLDNSHLDDKRRD